MAPVTCVAAVTAAAVVAAAAAVTAGAVVGAVAAVAVAQVVKCVAVKVKMLKIQNVNNYHKYAMSK